MRGVFQPIYYLFFDKTEVVQRDRGVVIINQHGDLEVLLAEPVVVQLMK